MAYSKRRRIGQGKGLLHSYRNRSTFVQTVGQLTFTLSFAEFRQNSIYSKTCQFDHLPILTIYQQNRLGSVKIAFTTTSITVFDAIRRNSSASNNVQEESMRNYFQQAGLRRQRLTSRSECDLVSSLQETLLQKTTFWKTKQIFLRMKLIIHC